MNDRRVNRLTPADEDPVIHRYLAVLPRHEPAAGLGDRVLVNVWLPKPRWLRNLEDRLRSPRAVRTRWVAVGGAALGSLVSTVTLGALIATFSAEIRGGLSWAWAEAVRLGAEVGPGAVVAARTAVSDTLAQVGLAGVNPYLLAGVVFSFWTFCAWGLYRTVTTAPWLRRSALYASR